MAVFAFCPRLQVTRDLTTRDHLTTDVATINEYALILAPLPGMMMPKISTP